MRHRDTEISNCGGWGHGRGGGGASLSPPVKTIHYLFGSGRASPEYRTQEKLRVVDQTTEKKDDSTRKSKVVTRVQKAKTGCTQAFGPEGKAGD